MGSIIAELNSTRTARWYDAASRTSRADAWAERLRCFSVLSELLAEQGAARGSAPRGLITEVARRANFSAHETVYKRFRSEWEGPIPRWAGADAMVRPRNALVAEAKIVSFWPYRGGVLQIAGRFDMTLPEVMEAYLRALAAWAADDLPLAACRPAGAPPCVAEDMAVLARAWVGQEGAIAEKAARLEALAGLVIASVLDDPTITPAGAFHAVRGELAGILARPADPVAEQLSRAAAQLSDHILHQAPGEIILTAQQASRLMATLTGLSRLLAGIAVADAPGDTGRGLAQGGTQ